MGLPEASPAVPGGSGKHFLTPSASVDLRSSQESSRKAPGCSPVSIFYDFKADFAMFLSYIFDVRNVKKLR